VLTLAICVFSLAVDFVREKNITGVISKPFSPRQILDKAEDMIG